MSSGDLRSVQGHTPSRSCLSRTGIPHVDRSSDLQPTIRARSRKSVFRHMSVNPKTCIRGRIRNLYRTLGNNSTARQIKIDRRSAGTSDWIRGESGNQANQLAVKLHSRQDVVLLMETIRTYRRMQSCLATCAPVFSDTCGAATGLAP